MTLKNPLGMIKDVATASLKVPLTVAGTAVDLARGAVGAVIGGEKDIQPRKQYDAASDAADEPEPEPEPRLDISPDEPVNVTEELGLDPAPVEKPKPKKAATPEPVTSIDAEADPSDVDVTPADVAKAVGHSDPEKPGQT